MSYAEIAAFSIFGNNPGQLIEAASFAVRENPQSFAAHFAEVEVDLKTGEITLLNFVAAVDCGTPIQPAMVEAQVEGAVARGVGVALHEEGRFSPDGTLLNGNLGHYHLTTSRDIPLIKTFLVSTFEPTGPFGAKSAGIVSLGGVAPAIAGAVFNAIGVRLHQLPMSPERVFQGISSRA